MEIKVTTFSVFMEDKGLTASLSSNGGQEKKVWGLPFGCPHLCGGTLQYLTSYSIQVMGAAGNI